MTGRDGPWVVPQFVPKMKSAADYLRLPYTHALVRDEETGTFTAYIAEFPDCVAQGNSPGEAYERLDEVAVEWIGAALEQGDAIPPPFQTHGYSGRVALRLPRTLHKQAAQMAEIEDTSLNQLIVSAISERVGVTNLYGKLVRALKHEMWPVVVNIAVGSGRATTDQGVHGYEISQPEAVRELVKAAQLAVRSIDAEQFDSRDQVERRRDVGDLLAAALDSPALRGLGEKT